MMTDRALPTYRPAKAAIAWATKAEIFVEIPHAQPGQPPLICRYRKTVDGLTAALNVLIEHAEAAPRAVPQAHPATKKSVVNRAPWATEDQRAKVRELLIKRGIIKI